MARTPAVFSRTWGVWSAKPVSTSTRRSGLPERNTAAVSLRSRGTMRIAAAAVEYPDSQRGLLLLVKPTLLGNEPSDVVQYAANHSRFPQEPTSDQFFDEAQWESYRKLGEHIGARL